MFSFASVLPEKQLKRDTKLIANLRRQYSIFTDGLGRKNTDIPYWAPSLHDSAQYGPHFFQLAVNIYLLLTEFEGGTINYGPIFFLQFMAQARSARAISRREK